MTEKAKRGPGRPKKEVQGRTLEIELAQHHYDYLRFLVVVEKRYSTSVLGAAQFLLTEKLNALEQEMPFDSTKLPPEAESRTSAKGLLT